MIIIYEKDDAEIKTFGIHNAKADLILTEEKGNLYRVQKCLDVNLKDQVLTLNTILDFHTSYKEKTKSGTSFY